MTRQQNTQLHDRWADGLTMLTKQTTGSLLAVDQLAIFEVRSGGQESE